MHSFVIGGTGFIGRFLVPKLLERGGTDYLLVRDSSVSKVEDLRELRGAEQDQVIAVAGDPGKRKLGVKPAWIKAPAGIACPPLVSYAQAPWDYWLYNPCRAES